MSKGYGKSAFVKGREIYSTDGNDVDVNAVAHSGMTVKQIVEWHLKQPEIRAENRAIVLLWFIGIPAICFLIIWLALSVAEWFI
jgi:hypothetical protein